MNLEVVYFSSGVLLGVKWIASEHAERHVQKGVVL